MAITTISLNSYQFENLYHGHRQHRYSSSIHKTCNARWVPTATNGFCNTMRQHAYMFSINRSGPAHRSIRTDLNAANNPFPAPPIPSGSPVPGWSKWLLFTILPILLPLLAGKWGKLGFRQKMGSTLQMIEDISETIESVAVKVDRIADEVSENLPQGSKVRNIIEMIDDIAEETVKKADSTQELLEKVEDVQDRVEIIMKQSAQEKKEATEKAEDVQDKVEIIMKQSSQEKKEATEKAEEEK